MQQPQVGVLRAGGDQRAVDLVVLEQALHLVEGAEQRKLVRAAVLGAERHPADDVRPGAAAIELGRQPVRGLGVAEDHAAFLGDERPGDPPRDAAADQHQDEQQAPENGGLLAPKSPSTIALPARKASSV